MTPSRKNPRVLIVTPEVTYLSQRMDSFSHALTAKAGGLADVSAALIHALFEQGADVHVAMPDYRALFSDKLAPVLKKEMNRIQRKMPDDRIHLAEDRAFYYINRVYSYFGDENVKLSLAFQREVINNIIPHVQPDLIHCNDWMTGLIPAMARQMGIPCLFTVHNVHTVKTTLAFIEDRGIDAAYFWQHLYYERMAFEYEETRESNPVDFLTSGVFAAHFVNTVSPTFLQEVVEGLAVPDAGLELVGLGPELLVGKRVQALEAQLGVRLLDRVGKKVYLTLRPAAADTGIVFRRVDLDLLPAEVDANLPYIVPDTEPTEWRK